MKERVDPFSHSKISRDDEGNLLINFGPYGQETELAAFSGDGTRLATVEHVGTATVWDLGLGTVVSKIRPTSPLAGRKDKSPSSGEFQVFIESIALNGDGTLTLIGLNDGTAGIFSTESGDRLCTFHEPHSEPAAHWCVLRAVAFSPDGSLAIVGFPGRSVGIWKSSTFELVRFLPGLYPRRLFRAPVVRDTFVSSVGMSSDGRYVFGGCVDMTARIWDLESGAIVFEAHEHIEDILAVKVGQNGIRWITSGGCVWEGFPDRKAVKLLATEESWTSAEFDPADGSVIVETLEGARKRWSLDGQAIELARSPRRWPFFRSPIDAPKELSLSDGRSVEIGEMALKVRKGKKRLLEISVPYDLERQWFVAEDESFVVGVFAMQIILCWSLDTGRQLPPFVPTICRPEIVPGLAIVDRRAKGFQPRASCCLWRTAWGNFIHLGDGPRGWVTPLTITSDGRFLILPGRKTAALVDLQDAQKIVMLFRFEGRLRASCIGPKKVLMLNSTGELFVAER